MTDKQRLKFLELCQQALIAKVHADDARQKTNDLIKRRKYEKGTVMWQLERIEIVKFNRLMRRILKLDPKLFSR